MNTPYRPKKKIHAHIFRVWPYCSEFLLCYSVSKTTSCCQQTAQTQVWKYYANTLGWKSLLEEVFKNPSLEMVSPRVWTSVPWHTLLILRVLRGILLVHQCHDSTIFHWFNYPQLLCGHDFVELTVCKTITWIMYVIKWDFVIVVFRPVYQQLIVPCSPQGFRPEAQQIVSDAWFGLNTASASNCCIQLPLTKV